MSEPAGLAGARPAATVAVLRPGAGGLETLLLRRSRKSGFFPSAWVFPGGRVDDADSHSASRGAVSGLPDADRAFAVAACRECFEEAGVWLGAGRADVQLRDALNGRQATLLDAPHLVADLDRLLLWAWWITPEVEPKRYDTRFFVALVDAVEADHAVHDNRETVDSVWLTADEALRRHVAGDLFMAPPTFRTLEELAECGDRAAVEAAARARSVVPTMPRLELGEHVRLVLPGHSSYPSPQPATGSKCIVYADGIWRSED